MVTIGYDFYKDTYKGELDEESFNASLPKAMKFVRSRTNNRIDSIDDSDGNAGIVYDIRACICNVVDKVHSYSSSDGKVVSSRSSGKLSETYVVGKTVEGDLADVVKFWLSGYGFTSVVWI